MLTSLTAFACFLLTQGCKFHVWHVHQYGLLAVAAVLFGKMLRRPVVLKLTSTGVQGLGKVASELPFPYFAKHILLKADAVVALTRGTRAEAIAFGLPPGRVHVLGNGVDLNRHRLASENERLSLRSKLGLEASGVLLFVGRIAAEKNPGGLLEAWKAALPNLPEGWKLVMVGEGPLRADMEAMADSTEFKESVFFAGQQGNAEEWMRAADIFALPSHNEGLSNTMIEAMASGLPVVSTRVSGSEELLGQSGAGWVVDVGRMDKLAAALVGLAGAPALRSRMGQLGRAVIEDRYSTDCVAAMHEELYQSLVFKRDSFGGAD
jgi:glycosyltransferase involved in cell wall biosynthesis